MRTIILDTESASLDPKDGIVEIAIIEVDQNFETIEMHHSLIDPEGPISFSASGVHGIVSADVQDAPTLYQFFDTPETRKYTEEDLLIIGHNIPFDIRMVGEYLTEGCIPVCTLRLARSMYPEAENHRLQTLRYMFGLEAGAAHSALGDTILTQNLVKMIASDLGEDAYGLMEICKNPLKVHRMSFGKHFGSLLHDLPSHYVSWLLKQDLDDDLRHSLTNL